MDSPDNVIGQFVEWSKKAEELSEPRADSDGKEGIPDKKTNNGMFGDMALFPGDIGVSDIGDNGGDGGGNKSR